MRDQRIYDVIDRLMTYVEGEKNHEGSGTEISADC